MYSNYRTVSEALFKEFDSNLPERLLPTTDSRWPIWLLADIEGLAVIHGVDEVLDRADKLLKNHKISPTKVNLDKIREHCAIRTDWAKALRSVKKGWDLSHKIGYSFYKEDLIKLLKLHKSGRHQKKIEELLEDCNFHSFCSFLIDKNYKKAAAYEELNIDEKHKFSDKDIPNLVSNKKLDSKDIYGLAIYYDNKVYRDVSSPDKARKIVKQMLDDGFKPSRISIIGKEMVSIDDGLNPSWVKETLKDPVIKEYQSAANEKNKTTAKRKGGVVV